MDNTISNNDRLKNKYRNEVVERMTQEICLLELCTDFVRDDSYHGHIAHNHIMYKLPTLFSKDGKRAYEFLFEFDKEDYEYGIYFGCKGLIFDGNVLEQIIIFDKEWGRIKERIIKKLNRNFRGNDFDKRVRITNNCNDYTYWPFWIKLYEDENILIKGKKALTIIRDVYKKALKLTDVGGTDMHHVSGVTRITSNQQTKYPNWKKLPFKDGWTDKTRIVLSQLLDGSTGNPKKKHFFIAIYIVLHAIAFKEAFERDRPDFSRALYEIAPDFCENENKPKDSINYFYSRKGKTNGHIISEVFNITTFTSVDLKDNSIESYIRNSCLAIYTQDDKHNVSKPCQKEIECITDAARKVFEALMN